MQIPALGFLLGILLCQQLAHLPDYHWTLLLFLCFPAAIFIRPFIDKRAPQAHRWRLQWLWRLPLLIISGFLWAVLVAHSQLSHSLDPELEGRDLMVTGTVASLPEVKHHLTRFEFTVTTLSTADHDSGEPIERHDDFKILLSWYQHAPQLQVGQRWQLRVRLKRPNGFMNPGGFDYERWLFQKGILARGYVRTERKSEPRNSAQIVLLDSGINGYYIDRLRERMRDAIDQRLPHDAMAGMVKALAIGDRQAIAQDQWQVLLRTGTNHLLAISGLHVGLIAGLAFFLMRWLWSRSSRAVLWLAAPRAAAIASVSAAAAYAALAGFAIPTQRALLMVLVIMLAQFIQRQSRPWHTLSLALFGVLLVDPMAVLEAGFWLSFAAVGVILFGMTGRLPWQGRWTGLWWRWGRVQWLVAIGLAPLLLFYFQRLSLVAPLANLVAVPWVSLVTVPVTLLGSVLLFVWPQAGDGLLQLASVSLQGLWWVLNDLAAWPLAQWSHAAPPSWILVPTGLGMLWLLAPRGFPARWLGLCGMLPLGLWHPPPLDAGEARFTLLDVGQGLSAVVQTRDHTLVFDTGPRFSHDFDTGRAVIVPYLRQAGVGSLDVLVVSHGDNDHIGGTQSLLAQVPTQKVLSSVVKQIPWAAAQDCRRGQHWSWDGVDFQLLHPGTEPFPGDTRENNLSCVLRVQAHHGSALLTGDIEAAAERELLSRTGDPSSSLHADILVAPHHGSRTSSTVPFIRAVAPRYVLFPVGYRNRYGFPKPAIVERYLQQNIALLDTARNGAITFDLGGDAGVKLESTWRQAAQRYWHRTAASSLLH